MMMLTLYWAFFQVGLFAFGGDWPRPLIRGAGGHPPWLDMAAFTDLVTIAEMTRAHRAQRRDLCGQPGGRGGRGGGDSGLHHTLPDDRADSGAPVQRLAGQTCLCRRAFRPAPGRGRADRLCRHEHRHLALFGTGGFTSLAAIDIVSLIAGAALFLLRKFKVSPILIIFGAGIAGAAIKLAFNLP